MEKRLKEYDEVAEIMVSAYEFTGTQNDAIAYVKKKTDRVDTLTLIAMWRAINAFNRTSRLEHD